MTSITLPLPSAESAPLAVVRGMPEGSRIDRSRKIIFGVAALQKGPVNDDRPWLADDVSLEQAGKLIRSQGKGLKSRFKHPSASDDGLGKFLGRARKPRLSEDGDLLLVDLHLSPLAFKGIRSDLGQSLGDYVLDLAENDPDVFGLSLAPKYAEEDMRELADRDGIMPMRFKSLGAVDFVDSPAATRGGLFGEGSLSIATAPHLAAESLDRLFVGATEGVIRQRVSGFLNNYLAERFRRSPDKKGEDMSDSISKTDLDNAISSAIKTNNETLLSSVNDTIAKALEGLKPKEEEPLSESQMAKVREAEQARIRDLHALASNAGLEDATKVADGWITKGLSVTDAQAALGKLVVDQNLLSKDAGGGGNDDPDAKYRREYRKDIAAHHAMGLSEADYILSRKIDDGTEILQPNMAESNED